MPSFVYRAVTDNGKIVRNRVEEISRKALIKKLIKNGLTPITIVQRNRRITSYSGKKKKRNITDVSNIIQESNGYVDMNEQGASKKSFFTQLNNKLIAETSKITLREVTIFTQDFYLLKKANFNNIHALSTIISSTENPTFKGILEDILAGLEAGEYMYSTM